MRGKVNKVICRVNCRKMRPKLNGGGRGHLFIHPFPLSHCKVKSQDEDEVEDEDEDEEEPSLHQVAM